MTKREPFSGSVIASHFIRREQRFFHHAGQSPKLEVDGGDLHSCRAARASSSASSTMLIAIESSCIVVSCRVCLNRPNAAMRGLSQADSAVVRRDDCGLSRSAELSFSSKSFRSSSSNSF